jgi:catechol 2,3-dioxygenase-like lactoylglutathione lyase family enzyme
VKTFNCKIIPPIRNQSGKWLEKGTGLENAKLEGAHLLLPGYGEDGPTLEIYQYQHIENNDLILPNTKGFGHIAFEVESVELVLENLKRNGGKAFGKITKKEVSGVGEITFIYARDPEGNLIELQSWK